MKVNRDEYPGNFLTYEQEWAKKDQELRDWVKYEMPKVEKFRLCFTFRDDYPWIEEIVLADGSMADNETIENFQECWENDLLPKDMWQHLTSRADELLWDPSNPGIDNGD